ncbi:MAG: alpha-amylase family glycosyl hydrolase [Defluviitaleaceae bacterium]|nr:alpha-amylase family glycosyl hydrolase [Defluviitaleaceae bacterium]
MQFSLDSKVRDIYNHPLGRDLIDKLLFQLGRSDWPLSKVEKLRLKSLKRLAERSVSPTFVNTVLDLLNSEPDTPSNEDAQRIHTWWKEAIFYQVHARSFTFEGIKGIYNKLDYLRELGVNAVRLCPVYDSPDDGNGNVTGSGIRDYLTIMQDYGTMRDMSALIAGLHKHGIKIIMDIAVNHTSNEHPWFVDALHNANSPYRDFYFFRKGRGNNPPNNWTMACGSPAWSYYPHQDIWALHLSSNTQMDLNWDSPALRYEIHKIIRWWLYKGVDGFRLDGINYISKFDNLPDGDELIGELMNRVGIERYYYGPRLHEYLLELRHNVLMPYNAIIIGETPGVGPMASRLLTDAYREELDMTFDYNHLEAPGMTRFDETYDLMYLRDFYIKHLNVDSGHGWNPLFFNNHDYPRMLSKVDQSGEYAEPLAKMLAVLQLTLRGTPFIYQGDEIGARNGDFKWDEVTRQQEVYESVWRFYQKLIAWRKKTPTCVYGALEFLDAEDDRIFCYCRTHEDMNIFVEVNLTAEIAQSFNPEGAVFVMGNYRHLVSDMQAYEARIYVY